MTSLAETTDLKKYFPIGGFLGRGRRTVRAVDGVTLEIDEGETLGLAGESGCGKTTLAALILGLLKPTEGVVRFRGRDIWKFSAREMRELRRELQVVFQDPFASLNPRSTLRKILRQPLMIHKVVGKSEIEDEIARVLEQVGLRPADTFLDRLPHMFSGGQQQRIAIARAISVRPKLLVADEPVSSLDISVRGEILNLLKEMQSSFGLTFLFITHDLAVLRSMANRVAIMYLGKIVEMAPTNELFTMPMHPYTKLLLASTPIPNPVVSRERKRIVLEGDVPSAIDPPAGCAFHTRCPIAQESCKKQTPELLHVGHDHYLACLAHASP